VPIGTAEPSGGSTCSASSGLPRPQHSTFESRGLRTEEYTQGRCHSISRTALLEATLQASVLDVVERGDRSLRPALLLVGQAGEGR
jgi:hypothetical protein